MFFRRAFMSDPIPDSSTNPSTTELNGHTTPNRNHTSGSELQEDGTLDPSSGSVRSSGRRLGTVDPLLTALSLKGKVDPNLFSDSSRFQESSEEGIYSDLPSNDTIRPRLNDHSREGNPTEDSGSSKEDQSAATTVSDKDQRKALLGPILQKVSNFPVENTANRKLSLEPILKRTVNSSSVEDAPITPIGDEQERAQDDKPRMRRSNSSFPSFLQKLVTPAPESSILTNSPSEATTEPSLLLSLLKSAPSSLPPITLEDDEEKKKRRRSKRSKNSFPMLHPVAESSTQDSDSVSISSKASGSSFGPSMLMATSPFARKMEEAGRLRRLQSLGILAPDVSQPPPSRPSEEEKTNEREMSTLPTSDSYSDLPDLISQHDVHNQKSKEGPSEEDHANKREMRTSDSDSESDLPELISQSDLNDQKAKDDEQQALHDALEQALREVEEAREEEARLIAEHNKEKWRLAQELKSSNDQVAELRRDNGIMKQKVATLQSQFSKSETELKALKKDQKSWQERLDTMHTRVVFADKQIRCLDSLSRSKVEARMEGAFGPTRRSTKASTKDPSAEVVGAVVSLNDEILQSANLLVENLERRRLGVGSPADILRAKTVVGSNMTSMLQRQGSSQGPGSRFLLMQATLEAFMVHWCINIIEGWYPRQQTFADLLVDLASQATTPNSSVFVNSKIECGKVKILDTTSSAMVKFPEWVSDILSDLAKILLVAGLRIRPNQSALFTSKFLILVKMAYNVRTALAEKDICGGLEASVVGPDMPFQPNWMEEAHAASRAKPSTTLEADLVANTSSIGLLRLVSVSVSKSRSELVPNTMVLKPKVVLVRVLEESP